MAATPPTGGSELEPPAVSRLGEVSGPTPAILGGLDMPGIRTIAGMVREQVRGARVRPAQARRYLASATFRLRSPSSDVRRTR